MAANVGHPSSPDPDRGPGGSEPDWNRVRSLLRRRLEARLSPGEREEIEDLVQEALVRLLRARGRGAIGNLDAFLHTLARRTWIDFIRRKRRWKLLMEAGGVDVTRLPAPDRAAPWLLGDIQERIETVVLLHFEREGHAECGSLARTFFAERSWNAVAEERNLSGAAVRKRWSRCLDALRNAVRTGEGLAGLLLGGSGAADPNPRGVEP